ncbi:hypothetical protein ACHWQZ_G000980 [Mnemiopsis leidyi]
MSIEKKLGQATTLYRNLLEELDSWGPYQPQSILLDYELAIHNAVAEVYPSSTRRGCFFHDKKALFKHLRQADLLDEYLVPDSSVRKFFSMICAIAFVPEDEVAQTWRHLKPLLPSDMDSFSTYYENTWIGSSTQQPNFSHDIAEQSLTDARHAKRLLRERREPRAPKWVRYDEQMQRIVDAYDDYSNKMDYLKAIGNRIML